MDIKKVVRPVFIKKRGATRYAFGGTCFYLKVGEDIYVITAEHVISDHDAFIMDHQKKNAEFVVEDLMHPTTVVATSKIYDIAILKSDYFPGDSLLPLDIEPPGNYRVGSLEYSRLDLKTNDKIITVNASTRIGNVVRVASDSLFPFSVYELSYPALKGASGSPSVYLDGPDMFSVFGVVVANANQELMPVQTYQYKGSDGEEETTHFYLPSALAIPIRHVIELLEK